MVCRSTPGNSAITTLARMNSGLHDVQVLSLFHEIRSEVPEGAFAPSDREIDAFCDQMVAAADRAEGLTERRRQDLLNRIEEARATRPDARTYYAWRNIEQRSVLARAAMDTHFTTIADRHGGTPEDAEAAFNQMMRRDHRIGGEQPAAPAHVPFATTHLPRDRRTRYALAMLHSHGTEVVRDEDIQAAAYRRIHENSDHIANNPHLDPANHCPDCGQFAGTNHTCPTAAPATEPSPPLAPSAQVMQDVTTAARAALNQEPAAPSLTPDEVRQALTTAARATVTNYRSSTRVVLPTDETLLAAASSSVQQTVDGRWVNSIEGFEYGDRERCIQDEAAAILAQSLRSAVQSGADLSDDDAARVVIETRATLGTSNGGWVTSDHARFERGSDAVLHQVYLDREAARADENTAAGGAQNCPDCGQFMGSDHTCDPLAAWEAELAGEPNPSRRPRLGMIDQYGRLHDVTPDETDEAPAATADTPAEAPAVPQPAQAAPATPTRQRTPMRTYRPTEGAAINMMNVSAVRQALREAGPGGLVTLDDVQVRVPVPEEAGVAHIVTGSLDVTDTGQRRTRTRDRYLATTTPTTDTGGDAADANTDGATVERSLRCDCPQYRETYDCPHVRYATQQVQALLNQREPVAVPPRAALDAVAEDLRHEYDASLAASQQARAAFTEGSDNVSYGNDMAAFQSAWDEAKAHFATGDHRLPYMYENATNGLGARDGGRSFGLEIEIDFPEDMTYEAKHRVAREIYEAGLSDSDQVRPWHWRARQIGPRGQTYGGGYTDNPNMWSVEHDSSVDGLNGQRGCEIVSPILYDTPETWRNLKTICDIVERNGGTVTPRTGLHVNVGAADFDHTVGTHNNLIGMARAYEDVLVRASHNPQSGPRHRGRDYCRPMSMPAEGFTSIRQARQSIDPQNYQGSSHRAMINLDHVPAEGEEIRHSTRVEVRVFDGAIDPGRIQTNVKMSLGLVDAAVRGVEVPRDIEPAGTHRTRNLGSNGRMRRLRGEEWENDTRSFRELADKLFSRAEDKKQMVYAFSASRWQTQ